MNNMTALVSCFVRAYHTENSNIKVYNDAFGLPKDLCMFLFGFVPQESHNFRNPELKKEA